MKKTVSISGKLVAPLQEGNSAIIRRSGDFIRTSPVVEILEVTDNYVSFETMNTLYQLSMDPVPIKAGALRMLQRCA